MRKTLLSSIVALSAVIGGGAWASSFDAGQTVATNFYNFYTALAGGESYTYNDGSTNHTIDRAFAAEHPNTTRDALGQLLLGSSDSNAAGASSYSGVAHAVDTYVGLTGALISRDTLGVDVSDPLDTDGHIKAYTGTNYLAEATSMADADKKLDTEIAALNTALGGKVDAIAGMGLSTNDYSVADKAKVDAMGTAAGTNIAVTFDSTAYDDSTYPTLNDKISQWAYENSTNVATVGQTFDVFQQKLNEVQGDINTAFANYSTTAEITTELTNKWNQAEAWVGKELGYDTTTTDVATIFNGEFSDQTGDGKIGLIDAVLENKAAIDTKTGLADDNVFTGQNTFQNANGINISDGETTPTVANLKAENDGSHTILNISGVEGVTAGAFVADGANGGFMTDKFSADDTAIELKNSSDDTVFLVDNNGVMTLSDGTNTTTLTSTGNGLNVAEGLTVATNKFTVANSGNVTTKGSVNINGATLTGSSSALSSNKKIVSSNGFEVNSNNSLTSGGLKLAGTTVSGIDTDGTSVNSTSTTTLATSATIKIAGQNAAYTNTVTSGSNIPLNGNQTLKTALASLDTAIGNRTITSANTAINTALATDVASAFAATGNAIGNMTMGGTNVNGANNLTAAVNNIDAAIGNRTITSANTAVNTALATDVASAIATTGNIIGDMNMGGTNVNGANNLTAAINNIDNNIGDLGTLAAGTGSTGNALTNGSGTAPTTVVAALNNIDATMGQIHGLKNGNSHLKANSNLANGTTVEQHLVALDDAIGNRNISSANTSINTAMAGTSGSVAAAMETTGNLIGSMDFDGTRYIAGVTNLTDAVATLDNNLERVETKLEKAEYNLKSGLAAMSALSALVPNARDCGNTQLSVGTGVYADRVGIAFGGFHYLNDHVLFNAGASYGGTRDWAFRAGVTFGL